MDFATIQINYGNPAGFPMLKKEIITPAMTGNGNYFFLWRFFLRRFFLLCVAIL